MISAIVNIVSFVNTVSGRLRRKGNRKLLLVAGCWLVVGNALFGQTAGDYGTRYTDGSFRSWSTGTNWVICQTNLTWAGAIVAVNPPDNTINRVWIRSNSNITLDNTDQTCNNLTIYGNISWTGTGSLTIYENFDGNGSTTGAGRTIIINGNSTIPPGTNLTFGSILQINPGYTVTNNGIIFLDNNLIGSASSSTWTNSNNSYFSISGSLLTTGTLNASASGNTVEYLGTGAQDIKTPSTNYYNLVTSGGGTKTLSGDVSVNGTLTMTSGNIEAGTNTLKLTNSSSSALIYTSGTIVGRFQRGVVTPGANYLFPVGTSLYYRPAIFNFSALASGTNITAQFNPASPGSFTPYADDGINQLDYAFTDGFWNFVSSSTPVSTYSLSLDGNGFSSYIIDANSRISGRNAGSTAWQDFGTHGTVDILNSTITRTDLNVLNTTSFDFCFAGRCNISANAGIDVAICQGSSTLLNGSGGGTYSWSPSYGLSNPNIANPVANPGVTTTYTLTVTKGACISTDNVVVTVNASPTPPSVTNGERCGTGTVSLLASGAIAGEDYKWYDALTGGTLLQTNGSSFTTPSISATTNYYVIKYNTSTLCESTPRTLIVATVDNDPAITVQPLAPAAVCESSGIQTISVTATGYNLTYQWQENQGSGCVYTGTQTNTLTLTNPTLGMNGYQYRVIVTGGCGSPVTSNAVSIIIRANPVITVQPLAPAAVCESSGIQTISVTATGYNLTYQWQENQGSG
ncbi:MAG: hypothetical protein ABR927_10365, partial [Bacteroidales bacterium]